MKVAAGSWKCDVNYTWSFAWTCFLTLLPIIYVWSLPLLHKWLPKWIDVGDVNQGGSTSVSSYINNTQGTALMWAVMFYPSVFMWESKLIILKSMEKYKKLIRSISFWSLLLFQICFGLFLAFPVDYNESVHGIVVSAFCFFGIANFVVTFFNR